MAVNKPEPQVNFSIEDRPATKEQKEAGKRLFLRLINRALTDQRYTDTAKARAQAEGGDPPAASQNIDKQLAEGKPPSLTNRGASTYRSKINEA